MKILLTGGGTGGHFYPLIAVAEQLNKIADKEKILDLKIYYMSDSPYDKGSLFENGIEFISVPAGKIRNYKSFRNIIDLFKTGIGCMVALFKVFSVYPDVVFSKGAYASFPTLVATRILRIPVIIHDSDSVPGRVSLWSAKFAKRIAISYNTAVDYFPKEKTAWTGQPIRQTIIKKEEHGAFEYLKLDPSIPVILIIGGSSGAQRINDVVLEALPDLLKKYQIIHQVGQANLEDVKSRISIILEKDENKNKYFLYGNLNPLALKMSAGVATIVISRAGSMIFEIAAWGIPSIIIPISKEVSRDQSSNAFAYARSGACDVIEETNLKASVLAFEINKLMEDEARRNKMIESAKSFAKLDASETIAKEIINIALKHEE
jgi:UDP-N-acetylglucosamine--N-acetylmuramyl-(pentapeptide) pyrophosphoryl-undecaprenol N-acetylglucosamine transferase